MNKSLEEVKPCSHVKRYVESQAAGKPRRWWNLFGWLHVKHCPQCQEALERLKSYFGNVVDNGTSELDGDSSEVMDRIRNSMKSETAN